MKTNYLFLFIFASLLSFSICFGSSATSSVLSNNDYDTIINVSMKNPDYKINLTDEQRAGLLTYLNKKDKLSNSEKAFLANMSDNDFISALKLNSSLLNSSNAGVIADEFAKRVQKNVSILNDPANLKCRQEWLKFYGINDNSGGKFIFESFDGKVLTAKGGLLKIPLDYCVENDIELTLTESGFLLPNGASFSEGFIKKITKKGGSTIQEGTKYDIEGENLKSDISNLKLSKLGDAFNLNSKGGEITRGNEKYTLDGQSTLKIEFFDNGDGNKERTIINSDGKISIFEKTNDGWKENVGVQALIGETAKITKTGETIKIEKGIVERYDSNGNVIEGAITPINGQIQYTIPKGEEKNVLVLPSGNLLNIVSSNEVRKNVDINANGDITGAEYKLNNYGTKNVNVDLSKITAGELSLKNVKGVGKINKEGAIVGEAGFIKGLTVGQANDLTNSETGKLTIKSTEGTKVMESEDYSYTGPREKGYFEKVIPSESAYKKPINTYDIIDNKKVLTTQTYVKDEISYTSTSTNSFNSSFEATNKIQINNQYKKSIEETFDSKGNINPSANINNFKDSLNNLAKVLGRTSPRWGSLIEYCNKAGGKWDSSINSNKGGCV